MSWLFRDPVVIMKEIMPWLFKDPISSGLPIQSYEDVSFSGPKYPIYPQQSFLAQAIIITFIYLLALFIVQNLKKFLQRIQSYGDAPLLGPKILSTCQKSNQSQILIY